MGRLGALGTGMIPKESIGEIIKKSGIPYAIDQAQIKHISGEWSTLQFFSFEMSREQYQGSSVSFLHFDEEPPQDIVDECKMRILDCKGSMIFTFTPLSGVTPLYDDIMSNDKIFKVHISMNEAEHLDKDAIDSLLEGMSDYEKEARRNGIASVGSGKVFQFLEKDYTIEPFEIPSHWPRLGGLDVGLTHPTAAICLVKDPDSSTHYIINEYRVSNKTPIEHCAHLKHWGVKFAIDPSAFNRQIGTMTSVSSLYEDEGLELVKADNSVDKGIMEMRKLMGSGRLFVFTTCQDLLKELRTYRTNDSGKIIKTGEDLCLGGETEVVCPDGIRMLRDVRPGDMVATPVGFRRVSRWFNKGVRPTRRYVLGDSSSVLATPDHKFLVSGKGFVAIDSLRYGDKLISGGINAKSSNKRPDSSFSDTTGVHGFHLLQVRSLFQSPNGREQEVTTASGRMGDVQWCDLPGENVCPSHRWGQVEQRYIKPAIDVFGRSHEESHVNRGGKEKVCFSCFCWSRISKALARIKRGARLAFDDGPRGNEEANGQAGSCLQRVWLRLFGHGSAKAGKCREDIQILLSELQNESVSSKEKHSKCGCGGHGYCGEEGLRTLRIGILDKPEEVIEILHGEMLSIGLLEAEEVRETEVFDITVDGVNCFYLSNGAIASNCDSARYAIMGIDEHGEVMKRHRIYSSQKPFKPADPKVGY
jgi:phage terminase large subunit-like protein